MANQKKAPVFEVGTKKMSDTQLLELLSEVFPSYFQTDNLEFVHNYPLTLPINCRLEIVTDKPSEGHLCAVRKSRNSREQVKVFKTDMHTVHHFRWTSSLDAIEASRVEDDCFQLSIIRKPGEGFLSQLFLDALPAMKTEERQMEFCFSDSKYSQYNIWEQIEIRSDNSCMLIARSKND